MEVLVSADSDLSIRNDRDQTPVDIAATLKRKHREEILSRLRQHASFAEVAATAPHGSKPKKGDSSAQSTLEVKRLRASAALAPMASIDGGPASFQSRLSALCSLWGLVKYSHPYVAYRADVNWDSALLEALTSLSNLKKQSADIAEADFASVVSAMLVNLHDPNTRLVSNVEAGAESPIIPPEVRHQPVVELTKDKIAVVTLTDYEQFATDDADAKLEQMLNAFRSAASTASGIIFDVRSIPSRGVPLDSVKGTSQLGFLFSEAFRSFLADDLSLPTNRQRFFSGLPEQRRGFSSAFQHGFVVQDAEILSRSHDSHISLVVPAHGHNAAAGQKPLCFLVCRHTPQPVLDIAVALRSKGQAVFIYQAAEGDYQMKRPTGSPMPGSEHLVYEPYVAASVFHLPGTEGMKVFVRQNEKVSPDGTVGFHPDAVVIPSRVGAGSPPVTPKGPTAPVPNGIPTLPLAAESDAAIRIGVEFCTGRRPVPRQRLVYPNFNVRRVEDDFKSLGPFPSVEHRFLALFRLWNAVQYFFPYKPLMDSHWDDILFSSIDSYAVCSNALEYHIAVARTIKELADTHAFVRSAVLSAHVGVAVPPIKVTTLSSGEAVVSFVAPSLVADVKAGDVIISIDGVAATARREFLQSLFAASTPHAALWRSDMKLLAGEFKSAAKLSLSRKGADGTVDVEVERSLQASIPTYNDSLKPFQLLSATDKAGAQIGWVDLTRLTFTDADAALQLVSGCSSIIFDLRGYTKGTIYRIGPMLASSSSHVAYCETPTMMPTLLSDDLQPPTLKAVQTCVVPHANASIIPASTRLIALINEETLSHGEYAATFLKAVRPDITFVGSASNGALGNITNMILPGGIEIGFSGMGMTAADGASIQRRGLPADVLVRPTIESLTSRSDAVLDKALEVLSR